MKRQTTKAVAKLILIVAILLIMATFAAVLAEAKTPRNGKRMDAQGNIYIYKHGKLKTGWFTYHGKRYYGHKTKSACYPVGSVTQQGFRLKNGKMYYFGRGGAKLTHNDRYIGLNRHSTSVHYIYAPGMGGRRYRYNANRRRYQYLTNSGRWIDTGNQCYPYGMMDFQE